MEYNKKIKNNKNKYLYNCLYKIRLLVVIMIKKKNKLKMLKTLATRVKNPKKAYSAVMAAFLYFLKKKMYFFIMFLNKIAPPASSHTSTLCQLNPNYKTMFCSFILLF